MKQLCCFSQSAGRNLSVLCQASFLAAVPLTIWKKKRILVSSLDECAFFRLGEKCSASHEKYYLSEM